MFFFDADGNIGGLPAGWTDAGPVDPFVVVAAGRSPLHVGELLELAGLLERLRAGGTRSCKANYAAVVS